METIQEETPKKPNAIRKFFKIIGIIALVVVGLIVALIAYFWLDNYLAEKEQDKVKMTISYDTEKCTDKNYPLYITVANNSKGAIKKTSFDLQITAKGHSDNLSSYLTDYKTDVIIQPNYVSSNCWGYTLKPEYKYIIPEGLEFKISYQHATFEE